MFSRPRKATGMAARIVRLTLVVGVSTVVSAGVVALISTSKLATERAASRDLLAVQMVEGAIEDRLSTASGTLDRASMLVSSSENPAQAAKGVSALFSGSRSIFDEMVLADSSGKTLAVAPSSLRQASVVKRPAFQRALGGESGLVEIEEEAEDRLWMVRTTFAEDGSPLVILGRMDLRFIAATLERAAYAQGSRTVFLLGGGEALAVVGTEFGPDVSSAQWHSEGQGIGQVSLLLTDRTRVRGYYNDIEGAGTLEWRVVSVKPIALDFLDTVSAVAPSLLVLTLGGIVGVAVAWGVSARMVRPLRDLERTARNAAMGAYVKPLSVSGEDEIGRVASAFNEVALRLNALHDLSQLLASASRLDQVLDGILSAVGHIVGPGAAAIYLLDPAGEALDPVRTRGTGLAAAQPVALSRGGWLAEALREPVPVVLSTDPESMRLELPGLRGEHSAALAAPLVAGNDLLGLVVVLKDDEGGVSEAEREMVRTFSAQASVAVQTSRLFEIESESRRIAEALRAVAQELVRPTELASSLDRIRDIIADLFGSADTRILIADRSVLGLPPVDDPEAARTEAVDLVALRGVFDSVAGGAVIIERGVDKRVDAALGSEGASLLAVPIGLEGDHGGALIIALPEGQRRSDLLDVGRALADEIALALDNAYFYERAVARATNLETIFRISQAVGSSLQVNVVLNRVLDVVQKILSADAVMLWSYDSRRKTLGTAMVRGAVPAGVLHLELAPGEDLPGHIFDSGDPLVIRELAESMGGVAGSAASQGLGSLLGVPLLARGRPIGVLMVLASASDAFTDEEMNILQTFASQAALAIDTARLYSNEHEVASVLQQSILPEALPDFPEVETGAVYAPAGAEADIGGDYYDLFRAADSALWLSIADVCGKGVQAATKTSMIKYAVRALVAAGLSPSRVVREVNKMVAEAGETSDIVTLWVGRYDAVGESLCWANGGHPPGLLRRANGALESLSVTGPLLGAMSGAEFDELSVAIRPGDRILLYTDGVTEARRDGEFFGEERVRAVFDAQGSAQDHARGLLSAVRGFARADLRDDVAVLVVSALGMQDSKAHERETAS